MIPMRSISISDDVDLFLQTYERRLRAEGKSPLLIGQIASELFDLLFRRLPKGMLRSIPLYQGPDPYFAEHSIYTFSDGCLCGRYSSSGDHVLVISIDLVPSLQDAVATGISAA